MTKILNVMSSLDGGGVEAMITNYYFGFPDKDIIFDFIVHSTNKGILEDKLIDQGSKIFHITPKKVSFTKNIIEMNSIIKKGKYDAIYCHQNFMSFLPLLLGKINGIKIRIVHSHGCNPAKSIHKRILNFIFRVLIKIFATNYFACGMAAAKWLYGKKWKESYPKKVIIHNAIDLNKFSYSKKTRDILRKQYNVQDKICILHVGRFSYEKNHEFIIELMSHLPKKNYYLFLAGNGDLMENIKNYCEKMKLDNVTFLGVRRDINKFYSMADCFLLPSYHEGFPVTLVEAQMSGLKCIASTNVSTETKILNKTKYLPLDNIELWLSEIKKIDVDDRQSHYENLRNAGFDIANESNKLYELLKKICKE